MSHIVDLNNELIGDGGEFRFALNTRDRDSSKRRAHTQQKDQRSQALHGDAVLGDGRLFLVCYYTGQRVEKGRVSMRGCTLTALRWLYGDNHTGGRYILMFLTTKNVSFGEDVLPNDATSYICC